jgi:hypothetical protein
VSNSDTVHAIAEAAKRDGTTPEAAALELLEAAVLAQRPFEEIVEPIARSFDESGISEDELDELVTQTKRSPARKGDVTNSRCPSLHRASSLTVSLCTRNRQP